MQLTTSPTDATPRSPSTGARGRTRHWVVRAAVATLVVFAVAELGVRLADDRLPPPPDWPSTEYGLKERQIDRLADRAGGAGLVVVGSSIVDTSIDPAGLDPDVVGDRPAYNASLIGASPVIVEFWTNEVVVPALAPETVVIGLSSRDLNANAKDYAADDTRFFTLPAVKELAGTGSAAERLERRLADWSALVRHREALRRPLQSLFDYDPPDRNVPELTDDGFETQLTGLSFRLDPVVAAFFRNEPLLGFTVSERHLDALRRLIDHLRDNDTRVVLVDAPVTDAYIALHPRGADDYDAYQAAIAELADDSGAELIDVGVWPDERFSDPLHLNGDGAARLTDLVEAHLREDPR
ncbi:hypothetical protein BH20ACT2_BH20ACT2_23360 [soil metagenome]